jgi:cysteine-rich repeat protein
MRTSLIVLAVLCFIPSWASEPGQDCMTDSDCDNGQFCDGSETCEPAFVCSDDPATTCDPANTGNTCPDRGAGFCTESGFCSGDPMIRCEPTCAELQLGLCVPGNACQPGSDPCPGQTCDEVNDTCSCGNGELDPGEECDDGNNEDGDGCASDCTLDEPVPAVSYRGMLTLVVLLVTISTAVMLRRRRWPTHPRAGVS